MQFGNLLHHRRIDREAPGGIDDQHVVVMPFCVIERRERYIQRLLSRCRFEEINFELPGDGAQLFDRRRTVDVATREQGLALLFGKELRQFAARGRLARALQTGHQDHRRRGNGKIKRGVFTAHQARQFALHHAHQGLAWRKAADHLLAHGLFPDGGDEILHHRQGDVGLEQGHAHLAQRIANIGLGQARLAAQGLDDPGQTVGQVI